jgi:hypothetical protein
VSSCVSRPALTATPAWEPCEVRIKSRILDVDRTAPETARYAAGVKYASYAATSGKGTSPMSNGLESAGNRRSETASIARAFLHQMERRLEMHIANRDRLQDQVR